LSRRFADDNTPSMSTIERAVALLDLFITEQEIGVREMGRRLNISKSAAQRMASQLARAGLLANDGPSGRYNLGLRLIELGFLVQARSELLDVAGSMLKKVARLSGESVHLGMLKDLEIVFIGRVEGARSPNPASKMARRSETYTTSLGKAVLAFQGEATINRVIERGLHPRSTYTITDPAALRQELARVRRLGYATNVDEFMVGLHSIAAPIRSARGDVFAGVSVSGPADRMNAAKLHALAGPVISAAADISRALQPAPGPKAVATSSPHTTEADQQRAAATQPLGTATRSAGR